METKTMTYGSVRNQLLSKTRPDGIYTDPEDGTEYDMNDPYDRTDAVDVAVMRLEKQGYKIV